MNQLSKIITGEVKAPERKEMLAIARDIILEREDVTAVLGRLSDTLELTADLKVDSDETMAEAVQHTGALRRHAGALEAIRKDIVGVPTSVVNAYNDAFRECAGAASEGEAALQGKMNAYAVAKRRKANEEAAAALAAKEAANKAAQDARQEALWTATANDEAEANNAAQEAASEARRATVAAAQAVHVAKAPEPIKAASATALDKVVLVFHEVADIAQIPVEFITINVKAINRALARGVRVPGITTKEETVVKVRSR